LHVDLVVCSTRLAMGSDAEVSDRVNLNVAVRRRQARRCGSTPMYVNVESPTIAGLAFDTSPTYTSGRHSRGELAHRVTFASV
jgi:hypothetical protein